MNMNKNLCILAVDDEPSVLRVLQRSLEPAGFSVVPATNGGFALELMGERKPDLVLLDIMMPGLNGFQVLNKIRERCGVPVIMLTAMHEVTTLRDSLEMGADDFITKPFNSIELIARIRAKLRRSLQEPTSVGG